MDYPTDWQSPDAQPPKDESEAVGHQVRGKTIAIHSLAVSPAHQRKGLGKTIMRAYIQRMEDSATADRLALLAHDHLIPYYEGLGFTKRGESKATFGGGGWYDMVRLISSAL
jgi:ribosomal protein S18 acetylase RimI-like enzyme